MRKIKIIVIMCCIIFGTCVGCGVSQKDYDKLQTEKNELEEELTTNEQSTMEDDVETQTMTEDETEIQTMTEEEDTNNTEIDLPDGFVRITSKDALKLPDADGLTTVLSDTMEDIGVTGLATIDYGNLEENSGVITIQAYFVTDTAKRLIVPSMYITFTSTKEWSVVSIKDVDTGNYYYVPDDLKSTVDLYDYNTGEIISEKTETHDDVMDEYHQELERIDQEFKEDMKKLEEKYITDNTNVSELTYMDENVVDTTIADMKQYEYIKDVFIEVDEKKKEINIVVQIPSSTDTETAKMAGEDVARYLATMANFANSYYEMPSSNNIGGIYSKYNLIIYIDDGNGNYNIYGAKVTTSNKITWRY